MGIFFDQDWFDDRLKASGLTRAALAQAAGMSLDEVEMVFRDQRELDGEQVRAFARVLSADPEEVAERSGAADVSLAPKAGGLFAGTDAPRSGGFGGGMGGALSGGLGGAPRQDLVLARDVVSGLHERMDRLERLLELVIRKLDSR